MWLTTRPTIVPYYILFIIYIILYSSRHKHPLEAVTAAILKVLPIWYLALYVHKHKMGRWQLFQLHLPIDTHCPEISENPVAENGPGTNKKENSKQHVLTDNRKSYLSHFFRGLVISSIGDVCLVYIHLFKEGIFCFAIAQFCYLLALRKLYKCSNRAWIALPLGIFLYSVLFSGIDDFIFRIIILIYAILIHTMLFFAIASYESFPCSSTLCNVVGASLFVLSDFLIGYNRWVLVIPYAETIILFTYYVAQLLLTLGSC